MKNMNSKGFTLLEILIVLVILAVLAGLAIPGYISTVEKQRKQEALATLTAIRGSQQRFWNVNGTYTSTAANLDFDFTAVQAGTNPHFTYALNAGATSVNFGATATRNGVEKTAGPANYTVQIDAAGAITSQF